jgi:hypothetical protein
MAFNDNYIKLMVSTIGQMATAITRLDGTTQNITFSGSSLSVYFTPSSVKEGTLSSRAGTFIIGDSNTAFDKSQYNLISRIDDTDFLIIRYSKSNTSLQSTVAIQQVWQYNGADLADGEEIVIREVGYVCFENAGGSKFMVNREVLDTPITVKHNGDAFTLEMAIGG